MLRDSGGCDKWRTPKIDLEDEFYGGFRPTRWWVFTTNKRARLRWRSREWYRLKSL